MVSQWYLRRLRILSSIMLIVAALPLMQCAYWHLTEFGIYVDCGHRYNPFGGLTSVGFIGVTLFFASYVFPTTRVGQAVLS